MSTTSEPASADPWTATSFGFLTNQLARLITSELARALRPIGLAPAQFAVMVQLRDGRDSTPTELAALLGVEQPTMARTLQRMERDGLARRTSRPSDRRARPVSLTRRGQRCLAAAETVADGVNEAALEALDERERIHLIATMNRLVDHLRERHEPRPRRSAGGGGSTVVA